MDHHPEEQAPYIGKKDETEEALDWMEDQLRESLNRPGDWNCTVTGGEFWPLDPRAEEVDIRDIAHALSNVHDSAVLPGHRAARSRDDS